MSGRACNLAFVYPRITAGVVFFNLLSIESFRGGHTVMSGNAIEKKGSFHWAWVILAVCFVNLFINYAIRLGTARYCPR